ncbi:hypothetical protein K450DRAFT_253586 [Umbelopsis ramanniana AG]|uniref:Uncharacterized protein n=1 Tax=Umbelopsis ramanniana AG TaxID=1314678 RepID=A0AAD5E651_UMBRA|nr:uncharacterized protein K450DRAFT_253586 [Umbelopsis ramanniana AG]KAI8577085.1 hypothetical protein K450DRAFT_253586 [Umbelopsis ramanniana AG]
MSAANNIILIDFHRSLNDTIHAGHGATSVWKNLSQSVLRYYAASLATKRVESRPSIQLVSNEGRNKLNNHEGGGGRNPLEAMRTTLSSMSCPNVYSIQDRLPSAIEQLIIEIADQDDEEVHAKIMFFVLAKRNDEKGFEFYDEKDEIPSPKLDIRAVLYKVMRSIRTSNIANINFELIRLFPGNAPNDLTEQSEEKLLPNLSVSAINLSISDGTLDQALRDRSVKSFDLSNLDITFNGSDASSSMESTGAARFLFAHQNEHLDDESWGNSIQLDHVMTVRKHGLDLPLCRCLHPVVTDDIGFETSSLYSSLSDKSTILLHDRKEGSKAYYYTHALTQYGTSAFLLCFNRTPDKEFEQAKEQALELVEVKVEGWSNPSRMDKKASQTNFLFSKEMLVSNNIDSLNDIKSLVNINPNRYDMPPADFAILPGSHKAKTTERIERSSRWWLSMADSFSREMVSHHEVSPLQNYGDAFKVEKNLNGDILKQIRQELVSPGTTSKFPKGALDLVFAQLTAAASRGEHGQLFTKQLTNHDVRDLAKKIIVGLDIACKRFANAADGASELCVQIKKYIKDYQGTVYASRKEDIDTKTKDEAGSVDTAWTQINKYQNMTLREKEEATAPDSPMDIKTKGEPLPFAHQLPIGVTASRGRGRDSPRGRGGGTAFNPNFRGKRGGNDKYQVEAESAIPQYPDVRVAKPWLKVRRPDGRQAELSQKRKDEQLGDSTSLLWTYWKAEERRQFGSDASKSDGMIWVTDKRAQARKRVRKEFDGRLLDESSSTGRRQVDHIDIVNILPLE